MLLVIVNNNEYNKDCLNGQLKHKVFCNILDEQQWTQLAKELLCNLNSEETAKITGKTQYCYTQGCKRKCLQDTSEKILFTVIYT